MEVAAGGHLVGIRCNDRGLLQVLADLLAPVREVVGDPQPNMSVLRGAPARTPPHRLQHDCRTLVRSRSLRRVVTALWAFLSAYPAQASDDRALLDALALVRGDTAVLLPERLRPRLAGAEQALRGRGLSVADAVPALALDGGAVLIDPPSLPVDETALGALARLAPEPPEPPPVASPGRYRLVGWAWPGHGDGRARRRAEVVASAGREVRNRQALGAQRALETLREAVTGAPLVDLPVGDPATDTVLDVVDRLW